MPFLIRPFVTLSIRPLYMDVKQSNSMAVHTLVLLLLDADIGYSAITPDRWSVG